MAKYLSANIVSVLIVAITLSADAGPTITIHYDYYDIKGQTAAVLREEMNRNGVLWTNGNIYDAYTGWNVTWNFRYRTTDTDRSIHSVTTELSVEFRLPRWVNYENGPPALKRKWDVYIQSLQKHENGHKDIGVQAANEIERSIADLSPSATCDELAKAANRIARRIISQHAAMEREYDARTNFGETQGAVFP